MSVLYARTDTNVIVACPSRRKRIHVIVAAEEIAAEVFSNSKYRLGVQPEDTTSTRQVHFSARESTGVRVGAAFLLFMYSSIDGAYSCNTKY